MYLIGPVAFLTSLVRLRLCDGHRVRGHYPGPGTVLAKSGQAVLYRGSGDEGPNVSHSTPHPSLCGQEGHQQNPS